MSMTYNISYDIAAFFLLLIEMVYVRLQFAHDRYSNRLFIMLLHSSFFFSIVDIASSLMLSGYNRNVLLPLDRFIGSLFFLVNAFTFLVFYRYIVEYLGDKMERTVAYYIRTYFPFVFIVECLIANHYANIFFSSGKYGHYSYGYLILIIYIYPIYYFVLTILTLIKNRKVITVKQYISVISYIVLSLSSIVIQLFYPDVTVLGFAYALSMLIMILVLETPDYRNLIKTTESLRAVREELDQQIAFDKAFVEDMSNAICAPVGRILAKNKAYYHSSLDVNARELYKYVDGYGRQIRSVVNNMMEFVYIGEGRDEYETEEYSIRDAIEDVRDIMTPSITDSGNTLKVEIGQKIPDIMVGSSAILKQILVNLISSAIEHTKGGMIFLSVTYRKVDHENVNLIVSVEDTGIGFKREEVKRILQFNTKGRSWKKEVFDSKNFRIRITKKLIEQMHGKFSVDSAYGKGSVFTAVIPQGIADGHYYGS